MVSVRSICLCSVALLVAVPDVRAQDEAPAEDSAGGLPLDMEGAPIDPHHRFSDDLTEHPARYFIWYDDEGWHLRSTTPKNVFKFEGKITVEGGTFGRMRTVGFEQRGRYADSANASPDRTTIEFTIFTSTAFDGFDFTVNGSDARVTFEELKIGQRVYRNRIFVGEQGQHPEETTFSFPARP